MSDYNESSHRRDRHRRNRGRDGRNNESSASRGNQQARENAPRQDDRRDRRPELPPLPKLPTPLCARCGEPIQDITSALADKDSGSPVHFDCVLEFLQGAEKLAANEKIVYIGQGRFAVVFFENPVDTRKFKIIRTIEWERREERAEWRTDVAGRFSQIK